MPIQNSIVVVNFNQAAALRRLLMTLKLEEAPAMEAIVVDNASGDESVEMVKRDFPQVRIVEREYNRGYAVAANRGIKHALGDVVVVCHSDVIATAHVLGELADRVRERAGRRVGAAIPRIIDGRKEEQPTVGRLPALGRALVGVFRPHAARQCDVPSFDHVADHEWAHFPCVALGGDILASVGTFDERFFLYYADADLCQRIHDRTYRISIARDLTVIHTGRSPNEEPPPHLARIMRNDQQKYFEKHRPKWEQGVLRLDVKLFRWIKKDRAEAAV
jgi:GT2 family glycosyltransferase